MTEVIEAGEVAEQETGANEGAASVLRSEGWFETPTSPAVAVTVPPGCPDSCGNSRGRSHGGRAILFKPDFAGFEVCISFLRKPNPGVRIEVAVGRARTSTVVGRGPVDAVVYECDSTGDWAPLVTWLQENAVGNHRFRAAVRYIAAGNPDGWRAECEAREQRREEMCDRRAARWRQKAEDKARREDEEWQGWSGRRYSFPGYNSDWRVVGPGEYASEDRKWVVERVRRHWYAYYKGKLFGEFVGGWLFDFGPREYVPFKSRSDAMVLIGEAEARGW